MRRSNSMMMMGLLTAHFCSFRPARRASASGGRRDGWEEKEKEKMGNLLGIRERPGSRRSAAEAAWISALLLRLLRPAEGLSGRALARG
jgi:hypothetical protein